MSFSIVVSAKRSPLGAQTGTKAEVGIRMRRLTGDEGKEADTLVRETVRERLLLPAGGFGANGKAGSGGPSATAPLSSVKSRPRPACFVGDSAGSMIERASHAARPR
jgi:hypothetical protein